MPIRNLERWKARFAALPAAVQAAAEQQLEANAEFLADQIKQAAPRSNDYEKSGGERLVDHVRAEKSTKGPASYLVICDPKDAKGHGYAMHVEFGHRAPGGKTGKHAGTKAHPFFFPTYRAFKTTLRRRLLTKTRAAAKGALSR